MGKTYKIDVFISDVDSRDARNRLSSMKDRLQNLRPVLKQASDKIERAWGENFTTMGALSAKAMLKGGWAPLSPAYQKWKRVRFPMTADQILVQTGSLRNMVTNASSNPGSDISDQSFELVVPGKLAMWHQYGTENMPARPIVFVPRNFDRDIAKSIASYVKQGSKIT